eukprot:4487801-Pleurochrysis_carterae.AAC.1
MLCGKRASVTGPTNNRALLPKERSATGGGRNDCHDLLKVTTLLERRSILLERRRPLAHVDAQRARALFARVRASAVEICLRACVDGYTCARARAREHVRALACRALACVLVRSRACLCAR